MKPAIIILLRSFVKSFYRENAGLFVFFMIVTVGAVGHLNGAGLMEYHYSLIMGMLTNRLFLLLVLLVWLAYGRKCTAFVLETIRDPRFSFLHVLRIMGKRSCFALLLLVQVLLYLPVVVYSCIVAGVAWHHHWWATAVVLLLFGPTVCLSATVLSVRTLYDPERKYLARLRARPMWGSARGSYPLILWRYIMHDLKMILAGIKAFTCGVLYLMAVNNNVSDYDLQFPFLFFSFGIFAHAIVIYRLRHFEETQLMFYRGFPVPLARRFLQYAGIYLALFLPEVVTIFLLMPVHLHYPDALHFILAGYSILLLLGSLSFADSFSMKDYLKLSLLVYGILYFFVATLSFTALFVAFLSLATLIFFLGYYRYQHDQ